MVAVECRSEQNPDEESAAETLSEVQSNAVHLGLIEEESSAGVMEGIDREGAETANSPILNTYGIVNDRHL